jgi:hypothetical protein
MQMMDFIPSIYDSSETEPLEDKKKEPYSAKRIIAITLLSFCALLGMCLLTAGVFIGKRALEWTAGKASYASVIDSFMTTMQRSDYYAAQALFSIKAQEVATIAKLEGMKKGGNAAIFDQYQNIRVDFINNISSLNTDSSLSGKFVNIKGAVQYSDGYMGQFTASLHLENGHWKIHSVNIIIPPDKIEKYVKANTNGQ